MIIITRCASELILRTSPSNFNNMITRYSLDFIQQLSRDFSAELEPEIIEKLLEIKKHNQFIARRKNPVQLKFYVLSSGKSSPEDMVYQNILSNLNKLSAKNYDSILEDIKSVINKNINILDIGRLSGEIFNKAIRDIQYSVLYCQLIRECSDMIRTKRPDQNLMDAIIYQCDKFYEQSISLEEQGITVETDYDTLCQFFKQKAKLLGGFLFIGSMYNNGLVKETLLTSYYNGLIQYIRTSPPECIDSFLDTICQLTKNTVEVWSKNISVEKKLMEPLGDLMRELEKKKALKSKQKFAILDVIEKLEVYVSGEREKDDSWTVVTRKK